MPKSWDEVKPRICELYKTHSLTRVQNILAREHNFRASLRSYRSYLKQWGVLKTGTQLQASVILVEQTSLGTIHRAMGPEVPSSSISFDFGTSSHVAAATAADFRQVSEREADHIFYEGCCEALQGLDFFSMMATLKNMPFVFQDGRDSFLHFLIKHPSLAWQVKYEICPKLVSVMIANGISVDSLSECGQTALQLAVKMRTSIAGRDGDERIFTKIFTKAGASVHHIDEHGNQILHLAIKTGACIREIISLIEAGSDVRLPTLRNDMTTTPIFLLSSQVEQRMTADLISVMELPQYIRALLMMLKRSTNEPLDFSATRVVHNVMLKFWCMCCLRPMPVTVREIVDDCLTLLLAVTPGELERFYSITDHSKRFGCECRSLLEFCTSHSSRHTKHELLDKILCAHLTSDDSLLQSLFTKDCPARCAFRQNRLVLASLRRIIHKIPVHRKEMLIDSMLEAHVLLEPSEHAQVAEYLRDINEGMAIILGSANMDMGAHPNRLKRLRMLSHIKDCAESFQLAETMLARDSIFVQHFVIPDLFKGGDEPVFAAFEFLSPDVDLAFKLEKKIINVITRIHVAIEPGPSLWAIKDTETRWITALRLRRRMGLPDIALDNGVTLRLLEHRTKP